jgi:HTH-type transcriptional regulator/antitoxin MqsA
MCRWGRQSENRSCRSGLYRNREWPLSLMFRAVIGGDGDGVHVGNDMSVVDRALRMLKEKVDGIPAPETIRKVRTKLRLSQRRAGALFRVGPNAFDKYERGLIEPSGPTVQLITILDRHPELVKELEGA